MKMPLEGLTEQIVAEWNARKPVQSLAKKYKVSRQAIYNVLHKQGVVTPHRRRPPRECKSCGRVFVANQTHLQTCSPECARVLRKKRVLERAKNLKWSRMILLDLTCARCGKKFQRTKYQQAISEYACNAGKKDFCSPKCNVYYQHGY